MGGRDEESGRNGGAAGDDRGGSTPGRSPNDDRSDAKNPTSGAFEADQENQRTQKKGG